MAERDYREVSYEIWQEMAPGWLREREYLWNTSRVVGEAMIAKLAPQPGQIILELACGVGDTGFAAATAVGDAGGLIASDFSPGMVDAARTRAKELGLENVEFRVMDAENMDLGDDSVDGVLCRWGYMLMSDPAAAFAETRRVLRDGGRLCFSVWGAPVANPWAAIPGMTVVERGHMPPPEPGAPGIFAMADPDRIRELVTGAGFSPPAIEEVEVEWRFSDADEIWRFLNEIAGGIALIIRGLPPDEQQAVRDLIAERLKPFASNGAYAVPGVALNVVTR
jgi:SAM-dependent methyltransferase